MSGLTGSMRPRPTGWVEHMPQGRFIGLVVTCLLAALALEDAVAIQGARPDFVVIALVYSAIRLGAAGGAAGGFGLGLFRDSLYLLDFGLHALGMTAIGYVVGKARENLYLTTNGVDVLILGGSKLALDILVLGVAAGGAWETFEQRFFWEAPAAALYTALLGAGLQRLFARP